MSDTEDDGKVRLDKWLWAARFFKTRAMATDAINGGHVHLNGSRVKPARAVQAGDRLDISKGPVSFTVVVQALSDRRGPAPEAARLYEETPESRERRERQAEERRLLADGSVQSPKRPDKRDRRRIIRFTGKG